MEDKPQVWHYGLVAQLWDEFWSANTPELAYFQTQIERYGQPVLDLGCGVGRLLLPLLRAGIDIAGCDISPDMLKYCDAKAERAGLTTHLYAQTMHEFSLPRLYQTPPLATTTELCYNGLHSTLGFICNQITHKTKGVQR